MNPLSCYSLPSLLRHAARLARDCDAVSFDLFDTLLIRRVPDPNMVKVPVARFIAARARDLGLHWSWQKVLGLRDKVEEEQRARTGKRYVDHEARYPDFIAETLSRLFGPRVPADFLAQVTDYELAVESAVLVPRSALVAWLRQCRAQGKRIFVMSDIYLPSEHLRRLIDRAGFLAELADVVSSADTFLAKASGKSFTMLRDKHKLDPGRWLHIGDNPISDGARPAELGIRALVLKDASEKLRKAIARRHIGCARTSPFWRGRALQQMMLPLESENVPRQPLYVEGSNFFAPLFGAAIQRLAERTIELGIQRIYFLSREGRTLKDIWERSAPALFPAAPLPEVRYLYSSRMALAGATCAYQGLTPENARIAFLPAGNRDIRDVCRIFRLNLEPLQPFLARYQLKEDTPISPLHAGRAPEAQIHFAQMLEDDEFQAEVKRQTRPQNDVLQRYLEQEQFFDLPAVAFMDIGWLGTIQRFLYEAVKHRSDKPRFHGFLFAASRGIPYPASWDNSLEGIVFDRDRFDFGGSLVMYSRDLFEEASRYPHPGVDGYRATARGIEPVFRSESDESARAEAAQDEHFAPLRAGILDAAPRYAAAAAVLGFQFSDLKPWLNYLLASKIAFPRTREVSLLRHKHHLDDFYGTHAAPRGLLRMQRHLWDCSPTALRLSPWLRLRFYLKHALSALHR